MLLTLKILQEDKTIFIFLDGFNVWHYLLTRKGTKTLFPLKKHVLPYKCSGERTHGYIIHTFHMKVTSCLVIWSLMYWCHVILSADALVERYFEVVSFTITFKPNISLLQDSTFSHLAYFRRKRYPKISIRNPSFPDTKQVPKPRHKVLRGRWLDSIKQGRKRSHTWKNILRTKVLIY